jgi:hypothetical protein
MLVKGVTMPETEYKTIKDLQKDMVLWLNDVPSPDIHNVIRKTTIVILRHTYLFEINKDT